MPSPSRRTEMVACSLRTVALALLLAAPAGALAQGTTDRVPYDGYLELDLGDGSAVPVDGPTSLRFSLWAPVSGPFEEVWAEEWSDAGSRSCGAVEDCRVDVIDGRFSVALGTFDTGLANVIRRADPLYLRIAVIGSDGAWLLLEGMQRIGATGYSMNATSATDFVAEGGVTTTGDADVGTNFNSGAVTTATADVTGELSGTTGSATNRVDAGSLSTTSGGIRVNGTRTTAESGGVSINSGGRQAMAFREESGNLVVGDATETPFSVITHGAATITGNLYCTGESGGSYCSAGSNLDMGTYTIGNDRPFRSYWFDTGTTTDYDTGISSSTFTCWVGGWRFGGGDPYTGGGGGAAAYLRNTGGTWHAILDWSSEGTHEDHEVAVICSRNISTNRVSGGWY